MSISSRQQKLMSVLQKKISECVEMNYQVMAGSDRNAQATFLKTLDVRAEEIGNIASLIGLKGFARVCSRLRNNFQLLAVQKTMFSPDVIVLINSWAVPLSGYYHSIGVESQEEAAVEVILAFLSDPAWPSPLEPSSIADLEYVFSETFLLHVDSTSPVLITKAMASLVIPADVERFILSDFLSELSYQAEAFDCAIEQYLITEDDLQLRVAQRIAHNIKGSANAVGVRGLSYLMHYAEDALGFSSKIIQSDNNLAFILQDVADYLSLIADYLNGLGPEPEGVVAVIQSVLNFVRSHSTTKAEFETKKIEGIKIISEPKEFHLENLMAFNDPGLRVDPPMSPVDPLNFRGKENNVKELIPSIEKKFMDFSDEVNEVELMDDDSKPLFDDIDSWTKSELMFELSESQAEAESFDALMLDLQKHEMQSDQEHVQVSGSLEGNNTGVAGGRDAEHLDSVALVEGSPESGKSLIIAEEQKRELVRLSGEAQKGNARILNLIEMLLSASQVSSDLSESDDSVLAIDLGELLSIKQLVLKQSQVGLAMQNILSEVSLLPHNILVSSEIEESEQVKLISSQTLIIRINGSRICILSESLERIVYVENTCISSSEKGIFYRLSGESDVLPIFKFNDLIFPDLTASTDVYGAMVVSTNKAGKRCGVLIESIASSEKQSIKPLGQFDPRAPGVVGSTVLSDGALVPVVDIHKLIS